MSITQTFRAFTAPVTPAPAAPETVEASSDADGDSDAVDPVETMHALLPGILSRTLHNQIYGITLTIPREPSFTNRLVLTKFLRGNYGDPAVAADKLEKVLQFRKQWGVDEQGWVERNLTEGNKGTFKGLGWVERWKGDDGGEKIVVWNKYDGIKEKTQDLDAFIRWRLALMEHSISLLNISTTTTPVPPYPSPEPDPHRLVQVHDCSTISLLAVPAALRTVVLMLASNYPEFLQQMIFVGLPRSVGWMLGVVKLLVRKETGDKFVCVANEAEARALLGKKVEGGGKL